MATDLFVLAGFSITMGLILTVMGLSFLSQNLKSLEFTDQWGANTTNQYYKNPFYTLNSKYWHYRPKGAVVVTKKQWEDIEKNIGIKVTEAKKRGLKLGRKSLMIDIEDAIKEKQATTFPTSPYAVLQVESSAPMDEIRQRYEFLKGIYDPRNFVELDKTFIELADIRCKQLDKAWKSINYGLTSSKGDI